MKRRPIKCKCGKFVRQRLSDGRLVWHRDPDPRGRKWCSASPRYKAKQPRAVVVDA